MQAIKRRRPHFLMKSVNRELFLHSITGAIGEVARILQIITGGQRCCLALPKITFGGSVSDQLNAAYLQLFKYMDGILKFFRHFAGARFADRDFVHLNYLFLLLFDELKDSDDLGPVLMQAADDYNSLCVLTRVFHPGDKTWHEIRGRYDEFKESVGRVVDRIIELGLVAGEGMEGGGGQVPRIGPWCRSFVRFYSRAIGVLRFVRGGFYITPESNKVWNIVEKLIVTEDPEGWVCLGNSNWQGAFMRNVKEPGSALAGSMELLKYIHPRCNGRGNRGWFRLEPEVKKMKIYDS